MRDLPEKQCNERLDEKSSKLTLRAYSPVINRIQHVHVPTTTKNTDQQSLVHGVADANDDNAICSPVNIG